MDVNKIDEIFIQIYVESSVSFDHEKLKERRECQR